MPVFPLLLPPLFPPIPPPPPGPPGGPPGGGGGGGGGGDPTGTETTTTRTSSKSSTSSSSSTSSAPTGAATQYLIVAQDGVSQTDFQAFADQLPKNDTDQDLSYPGFLIAHVATLNSTWFTTVTNSPLVHSVVVNSIGGSDTEDTSPSSKRLTRRRTHGDAQESASKAKVNSYAQKRGLPNQLSPQGPLIPATNLLWRPRPVDASGAVEATAIEHLELLSAAWFDGNNPEGKPANALPGYMYESTAGRGVTIYVVDDGINLNHPVSTHPVGESCQAGFNAAN